MTHLNKTHSTSLHPKMTPPLADYSGSTNTIELPPASVLFDSWVALKLFQTKIPTRDRRSVAKLLMALSDGGGKEKFRLSLPYLQTIVNNYVLLAKHFEVILTDFASIDIYDKTAAVLDHHYRDFLHRCRKWKIMTRREEQEANLDDVLKGTDEHGDSERNSIPGQNKVSEDTEMLDMPADSEQPQMSGQHSDSEDSKSWDRCSDSEDSHILVELTDSECSGAWSEVSDIVERRDSVRSDGSEFEVI